MSAWQSMVLGLVEGLTEFLPISSTGHLILAQRALGLSNDAAAQAFAIAIQSGAILAVLAIYLPRLRGMGAGLLGRDENGRRLAFRILSAFLPAAVVGLAFEPLIKQHLFGLWPIVCAWFAGGAAILCVRKLHVSTPGIGRTLEHLSSRDACVVGLFQCLALWPGTSRSLATIAGGLLVGLSMPAAVEFSLLLGLFTLLAASSHQALQHGSEMLAQYGWANIGLGLAAAFVSAWVSVRWLVGYLGAHSLAVFGGYRIALAVCVAVWMVFFGLTVS